MRCSLLLVLLALACGDDPRSPRDGGATDGATDAPTRDVPFPDVRRSDMGVCETVSAVADALPATLVFQLDTSNSMNCPATDASCLTGDPTPAPDDSRWDVFRQELVGALGGLPDGHRVGVMRFPRSGGACANDELSAPIAELGASRATTVAVIDAITPDGLSTPTHDAVAFGLGRLADQDNPYLVLATDGDARVCFGCDTDCAFDDPRALDRDNDMLVERVRTAAAMGVPTFVIGVPGSQGYRDVLSRLATAAGTARAGCSDTGPTYCHYDLTDPGLDFGPALRDALGAIGDAVLSCEYTIPDNPDGTFDPAQVNVRIRTGDDEETIPRDPARADGWDYSDDMTRVELHGDACERARMADALDVLFGCPTILI